MIVVATIAIIVVTVVFADAPVITPCAVGFLVIVSQAIVKRFVSVFVVAGGILGWGNRCGPTSRGPSSQ